MANATQEQIKNRERANFARENGWLRAGIKNIIGDIFKIIDYDQLYKKQKGKCAICEKHSKYFKTRLAVDHSHKTGFARGLLCIKCNLIIGYFEDKNIYSKAKSYLIQFNKIVCK